eukprot:Sspe_Gene.96951::Locus_70580_Transcript_1_1_Confidence_1.000_Length_1711::g.96951::m.96951
MNEVIVQCKMRRMRISYPFLRGPKRLAVFADASFGGNPDRTSQGGLAAVLEAGGKGVLLEWASSKIRRICRSTLGAELLVASAAVDVGRWLQAMLYELGLLELGRKTVLCDAKSVTDTTGTTHAPREKHLSLDLTGMRRLVEDGEVEFLHIGTGEQVADALTKARASDVLLPRLSVENVVHLPPRPEPAFLAVPAPEEEAADWSAL